MPIRWYWTGRPIVPLSRDKEVFVSLCPGTKAEAKIPWQTLLSRDVPRQIEFLFIRQSKSCIVPSPFTSRILTGCPCQSCQDLARFWACPVVPFIPLSWKVTLSCPVGNPILDPGFSKKVSYLQIWCTNWFYREYFRSLTYNLLKLRFQICKIKTTLKYKIVWLKHPNLCMYHVLLLCFDEFLATVHHSPGSTKQSTMMRFYQFEKFKNQRARGAFKVI